MKYILSVIITLVMTAALPQDTQKLVYADFEQLDKDKRPISAREGKIIFDAGAQNNDRKPKLAPRLLGAQGPLTQRIGFEFEIFEPNTWAEASIKIIGLKDKGRLDDWAKTLIVRAEDLSAYSAVTVDIGAAGVSQVRIRLLSEENGIDAGGAFPERYLDITNELRTYRIPISEFKQPTGDWVKKKVTTEQVMKKLTAVQVSVVKVPSKGFVVLDNIAFEK
ncbi:MAG TPA: hypothetical protein VFD58_01780 [Blastocatellia bacterium]|nr:hypothetical protein [Blastocatellia bacterium]